MVKKIIKITAIVFIIVAGLSAVGFFGYPYYAGWRVKHFFAERKQFFVRDAKESRGGDTPMETYKAAREALKNNDIETALSYFFVDDREKYREIFSDPEAIQRYLKMPDELKEDYTTVCEGEAFACLERANYYYEYEVAGERKEYDLGDGYIAVSEPGIYKSPTSFIKNLADKWQIEEL